MEKSIFDIEKFNLISDEENYYFFRSLEPGDLEDIENGVITMENGYIRLRTDSKRWKENHPDQEPEYGEESQVSLEEMYKHIKMHYSLQTNCISLSSNANVARTYGEEFSEKYVMIKVPKREMGTRVFHAGQYMLEEIERRVNEVIDSAEISDEIRKDLEDIDKAQNSKDLREIIKIRYRAEKPLETKKAHLRGGITYRAPHARISSYQALDEEQTLEKNKVIAKLTVLERKGIMSPIISRSKDNNFLIQTMGSAFSSSEQIYYGDIEGERVQDIQREILDIFGLLQQIEGRTEEGKELLNKGLVEDLKKEVLKYVTSGNKLEISKDGSLAKEYKLKDDITIEEMYEKTNGRVEYGTANSIVKNLFYLVKAQSSARELAQILNEITGSNPKYEDVIKYIENNGFEIEPKITIRQSNRGVRLSESVNLDIRRNEREIVDRIKELSTEEQIEILENGGLSDVKEIMTSTFSKLQKDKEISKEEYYAEAIISMYNWREIGIAEFTIEQKNDLLSRLKEKDCIGIYKKLKEAGIEEKDIPSCILNIVSKGNLNEISTSENYIQLIQENKQELTSKLSIEQVEEFLGYYELEGTSINLRDYQETAVKNTREIYKDKRFASVVLPTGGGKSFVAMTEMLEHKDEAMIYLAPNNEILEQIKDDIIKCIHGTKGTLGKESKEAIIKDIFPNITFETYPGLLSKKGKEDINGKYDFIVLDELHRTGASEWGDKLDKLLENQSENTKVLRNNRNAYKRCRQ